jgi:hypothetical protein
MTLAEALLAKLAKWRPDSGRQTLDVAHPESGWAVAVESGHVELLGGRLWDVTLRSLRPAPKADLQGADLRARAEQVAARVTGLLEPLRLVEVDDARGLAQLRSDKPGNWGDGQFYYEVLLQADGGTNVRRYQAPAADQPRRQQVPFTLTHEALAKFVSDLTLP